MVKHSFPEHRSPVCAKYVNLKVTMAIFLNFFIVEFPCEKGDYKAKMGISTADC